ncbi:hypothetical protein EJ08DRAFT_700083 [Tothia fuscella]|uniref:Uncharacterized protein n=1 Tax=Tothia fuscella TaxID=1048955 RepID=A0A9P4NL37_9PEZI|nr:hypothetical protein EJ08DRAFT_700083 [Tothia fuscella]
MAAQSTNKPLETVNVPAKRRPRKLERVPIPSRSESAEGGAAFPRTQSNSGYQNQGDKKPNPNARKRRPKKTSSPDGEATTSTKPQAQEINTEVEALKSRVIEIEAQVQELLLRPTPIKTPRRRQRHQKGQEPEPEPDLSPEPQDEMKGLQRDLESARGDLAKLRSKAREIQTENVMQEEDEDIEEIPRLQGPGLEKRSSKQVTLSGSYRIPIPTAVSEHDLASIQRGISSAQNIARSFLDSRTEDKREAAETRSQELDAPQSGSSWVKWIGGYSMSIVRAVDNVKLSSRLEMTPHNDQRAISNTPRPAIGAGGRSRTTPTPRRRPPKLETRNSNSTSTMSASKRPPLRTSNSGSNRTLSNTQVAGLLA